MDIRFFSYYYLFIKNISLIDFPVSWLSSKLSFSTNIINVSAFTISHTDTKCNCFSFHSVYLVTFKFPCVYLELFFLY